MTVPAGRPPWPTPWPAVNRTVERLRDGVVEAVGDRLVGLYLHGSLAMGDFYPPASDIDFHAATAGVLDDPVLERLTALHTGFKAEGGWPARLEACTSRSRPCAVTTRPPARPRPSASTGTSAPAAQARPGSWTAG